MISKSASISSDDLAFESSVLNNVLFYQWPLFFIDISSYCIKIIKSYFTEK